ncbi:MAG: hypothetical protein R3E08_10370 [Thiotrichaceae bacterium]
MIKIPYFSLKTQFFVLLLCAPLAVWADARSTVIYKYVDEGGVLHLTNKKPKKESNNVLYSRSYMVQTYTPPQSVLIPLLAFPMPRVEPSKPGCGDKFRFR